MTQGFHYIGSVRKPDMPSTRKYAENPGNDPKIILVAEKRQLQISQNYMILIYFYFSNSLYGQQLHSNTTKVDISALPVDDVSTRLFEVFKNNVLRVAAP